MTLAAVMKRLKRDRLMTLSGLAEMVAGEPIRGSWWGHRAGNEIFDLATKLDDHEDVLSMKLVQGKVTFVHRSLWPALLRVVTDESWRRARIAKLDAASKRILNRVEDSEEPVTVKGAEKKALEQSMLVLATQQHSTSGKHVTVVQSWSRWASEHGIEPAKIPLDAAIDALKT